MEPQQEPRSVRSAGPAARARKPRPSARCSRPAARGAGRSPAPAGWPGARGPGPPSRRGESSGAGGVRGPRLSAGRRVVAPQVRKVLWGQLARTPFGEVSRGGRAELGSEAAASHGSGARGSGEGTERAGLGAAGASRAASGTRRSQGGWRGAGAGVWVERRRLRLPSSSGPRAQGDPGRGLPTSRASALRDLTVLGGDTYSEEQASPPPTVNLDLAQEPRDLSRGWAASALRARGWF